MLIPEGAKLFVPKKAGIYKLNIVCYTAGRGNPNADAGELYYERTYWAHTWCVGPNKDTYVCPAKTFGLPCPICEQRDRMEKDVGADEELVRNLFPKERQLWNVEVLDEPGVVQIWDVSYHLFGKFFRQKIQNAEGGEYDYCTDPEEGFTVRAGASEKTMGRKGKPFLIFDDLEFRQRDPLPNSLLDQAYCLDNIPKRVSYEDLKAAFLAEPDEDDGRHARRERDDDDDRPRGGPRNDRPAPQPEREERDRTEPAERRDERRDEQPRRERRFEMGMMVNHPQFGECEIVKLLDGGDKLRLEDAGLKYHEVSPDEVTLSKQPVR